MNPLYRLLTVCVLFLFLQAPSMYGQFVCKSVVTVQLDPNNSFTFFPEDILEEGDPSGFTSVITPATVNCDDLGLQSVMLEIFDGANLIFSCLTALLVEDHTYPVASCDNSLHVQLGENGQHTFTLDEINDGSYDNCDITQYVIQPQTVYCGDPNPLPVTLTTIDAFGNNSSCVIEVTWESYPNTSSALACNALVIMTLAYGQTAEVTPFMILEGGPYGCEEDYLVTVIDGGTPRPEPLVTAADTNNNLIVSIQEIASGVTCWGELTVVAIPGCDPSFVICDTECHGTPAGDCNSGHTLSDNIEWPCDLTFFNGCELVNLPLTPEYLVSEGLASADDARPRVTPEGCYEVGIAYDDVVFYQPIGQIIERHWVVIYWPTGQTWPYTQVIWLAIEPLDICDTLPWNTPAGDCASGHSLSDDVEWPADITITSLLTDPTSLSANPDVAPENVQPSINAECHQYAISYSDVQTIENDTTVRIVRTWSVFDYLTESEWPYDQVIIIHTSTTSSTVCTFREDNAAIPDVELTSTVYTDDAGCATFENPAGITVTPVKDAPLAEGVNVLDKILMMEHILGIIQLSPYQLYAADLNQNGVVSTFDAVLIDAILDGTFVPTFDHNWQFYHVPSNASSVDISNPLLPYTFIGVKMGDVDNSYPLASTSDLPAINLRAKDEILNHKEEYTIPFFLNQNTRLQGFSVRIENPDENLVMSNVSSSGLPLFEENAQIHIQPGAVEIRYVTPIEYLENGFTLPSGQTLFTIQFESEDDAILSEEIQLSQSYDQLLKPSRQTDAFELEFEWEDQIISSVIPLSDHLELEVYPNPFTDLLQIKGIPADMAGQIQITDGLGRVMLTQPLRAEIRLPDLSNGLYFMTVTTHEGYMATTTLVKE